MKINSDAYKGLKVLVTGATGFKGSWLIHWLKLMGAEVRGFGLSPESDPNLYESLKNNVSGDLQIKNILDREYLHELMSGFKPVLVFHLAAQPLVSVSYEDPRDTHMTNIFGLINLLEELRVSDSVRAAAIITSDKCYSTEYGKRKFKEDDPMGGMDPYSASKACAEIITKSYYNSFFREKPAAFATLRAGNIIGGGDWSRDRLIPDIVRSLTSGRKIVLRNPDSVRPWQHVLDALSGYLITAEMMMTGKLSGLNSFNFGPSLKTDYTVLKIAEDFAGKFFGDKFEIELRKPDFAETDYLRLDSSKSSDVLGWKSCWDTGKSLEKTADWYKRFYGGKETSSDICTEQIEDYLNDINI